MANGDLVRVVHCCNEQVFSLAGYRVGVARKALKEPFNIGVEAMGVVDGLPVCEDFILNGGQTLEFVVPSGQKGLGRLITKSQLLEEWSINQWQYDELLDLGLPVIQFLDGTVVHPEAAVDFFFLNMGDPDRRIEPDIVDSNYIAAKLGCTAIWITDLARRGEIPDSCVVQGSGNGKPWKFYKIRIDSWLRAR